MPRAREPPNPFRYFNSSLEVGIDICHETVRFWWQRFGALSKQTRLIGFALLAGPDEQGRQPLSLLQLVARSDPTGGDDVRQIPAVAA